MERRKFTQEFKLEAVRLITERGVSYTQAEQDLDVHQSQLRGWVKRFADDPQHAFPGQGQMKPEQLEIARLKREVIKLKAERDILKKAAPERPRRRRLPPDLGDRQVGSVAPNVLDRGFEAPASNRKWIADFTYAWTAEG
jgi:transposase